MSGFRTLAPAVQAALLAAIAAAAPDTTSVSLGYPPGGLAAEQVWVEGDFEFDVSLETSGWTQRQEDGTTEVRIAVTQTCDSFLGPQSRALELAAVVEDCLAADRTLGGVVDRCAVSKGKGQEAIPEEHTHQFGIILTVTWAGTATA